MKHKIEKNTVQETLIIPLFARKVCSELYPNLYRDETSIRLIDEIDYDFSEAEKNSRSLMQRFGALEVAMRQNDLAWEARDYLKSHPTAAVVNLGCGLDSTGRACDNGSCKIYNLDFPDVIAVRNELLPAGEREENIPCNLNDTAWFSQIDASGGAVFFASGVFYYFLTEQVKALVQAMAGAFPGGVLVFDAANRTAVKMIAKTWLKSAKIKDVGAYFAVSDAPKEIGAWDSRLQVTSRGYMLGYNDLRRPIRQRLFPFPRKGRRPWNEDADREDRIRRSAMKILVYGAGVLGCNLARNLFRAGKNVDPACAGKMGGGNREERTADQGQVFASHVGQQHPGRDQACAGCAIRCNLCRSALYAARFRFGHAAGEPDKKHRFCGKQCADKSACRRTA